MENSNTQPQTQDPPATEISEPMVEAAARAMCFDECDVWDTLQEQNSGPSLPYILSRADWRRLARVALIAGIAAALEKGR